MLPLSILPQLPACQILQSSTRNPTRKSKRARRNVSHRTVIADVEALLNARPLTHVSIDVNDLEPKTPNHFLYGRAIEYKPVIDSTNSSETASRQRIERVQALVQSVCERWMDKYLPNLIERKKWQIHRESLKIGDIVLIIQDNTESGH